MNKKEKPTGLKKEYKLLHNSNLLSLEKEVSSYLEKGWTLAGPAVPTNFDHTYLQTIVRYGR